MGGFAFVKTHLDKGDASSDYVYKPSQIVVEHTAEGKTKSSYYMTFSDALSKAEEGDVLRLLSDIELGTLSEGFVIDKSIIIDGLNPNGGMYKITANGSVNMFDLNGGDLTLQNVRIDYVSTSDDHAMIYANRTKGNLHVSNSVLFSKYRTLYFYEREHEYEIVVDQNSVLMSTDASETFFFQSYRNSNKRSTITIENALVAGASRYAMQLYNMKGSVNFKNGARIVTDGSAPEIRELFNVGSYSVDYPIYVGGASPTFITTLYGNAEISGFGCKAIYYTNNASPNNKNVYYSEDYNASKVLVQDGRNLYMCPFRDTLLLFNNGSVRVPCNIDVTETLEVHGNISFVSSIVDTNGDGFIPESTITFLGTGNGFANWLGYEITFVKVNVVGS